MPLKIEEWHSAESGKPPGLDGLVAAAIAHDGRKPIDESALAELKAGAKEMPHAAFVARQDDELIGYAHVSFRATRHGWRTDLVVHPRARHEGVGSELTRKVFDHVAWDGGGTLHLWVPSDATSSKLAERFGFVPVRRLHQQHAALPAPTFPAPYGIEIRPFSDPDRDAWLLIHNLAFGDHPDAGGWSDTDFEWRTREPWFDADGLRLALDDRGQLLGSCWMKVHDHPDPAHDLSDTTSKRVAEIYMMGVAPQARGRGLAPALASDGLAWGVSKGADRAMLYVDESNAPAMRLYRGLGFQTTAIQVCLEVEIPAR